jgi:hypothetical protein
MPTMKLEGMMFEDQPSPLLEDGTKDETAHSHSNACLPNGAPTSRSLRPMPESTAVSSP